MGNATKMKKAIKIDVALQQVYEVEIADGLQQFMMHRYGCSLMDVRAVCPTKIQSHLGMTSMWTKKGLFAVSSTLLGVFN